MGGGETVGVVLLETRSKKGHQKKGRKYTVVEKCE